MMDGAIWVSSEPGKGASFSFTVCLARGRDSRESSPSGAFGGKRVLAADSDGQTLAFFQSAAGRLGFTCDTASNELDALALFARRGAYDMCFIDVNVPENGGVELARAISAGGSGAPVILLASAAEWNELQSRAADADIAGFLPKPLFFSAIEGCMAEHWGAEDDDDAAGAAELSLEGRRILLAEDVDINREIVQALLEPTGLAIDCAVNGAEAVAMFLADPGKYDMVFMDLQMPEMDGYTATRKIRASGAERALTIPIVAMTANVFTEDINKCEEAGMNGHIGKPLDFAEVTAALRRHLPGGDGS
jgi:CheY-like chemotaxis protein